MKILLSAALAVLPLHCDTPAPAHTPTPAQQCSGESREAVDALQFSYGVLEPVDAAFRMVAADCGWTQQSIDEWAPFLVYDVIAKESGGCWNVRRGVKLANGGLNCEIARQGKGSDSGFFQLISIHYKPGKGWLCLEDGLCSSEAIISSPYTSMQAGVRLVQRSGKQGWCYSRAARSYHRGCATAPRGTPQLVG